VLSQERGAITGEALIAAVGWSKERADAALLGLLKEGLAMVDDGAADGIRLYWFPCCSITTPAAQASPRPP